MWICGVYRSEVQMLDTSGNEASHPATLTRTGGGLIQVEVLYPSDEQMSGFAYKQIQGGKK